VGEQARTAHRIAICTSRGRGVLREPWVGFLAVGLRQGFRMWSVEVILAGEVEGGGREGSKQRYHLSPIAQGQKLSHFEAEDHLTQLFIRSVFLG
jgi:hypothetical protein